MLAVLKKEQAMVLNHMKMGALPGGAPPTSCLASVKRATWLSQRNKDALLAEFFCAIWPRAVASHPKADFLVLDV